MDLDQYDYFLPEKNLALAPATPRDSSKLFVYDTGSDEIVFDHFYNLDKYLPKESFLVLNNTKVLPARVTMKKESGGKAILLFLINELTPLRLPGFEGQAGLRVVKVIADRKINVGEKIFFDPSTSLRIRSQKENIFELEFDFGKEKLFHLLQKFGTMPIPPYLKKSPLKRDELMEKYQTIFARAPDGARLASAAAPTASLHFTEDVFEKLKKKGIDRYFVTLHVGLGTFAPLTEENMKKKKLHEEYFEVGKESLQCFKTLKSEGKRLVAVGTTVTRTLESVISNDKFQMANEIKNPNDKIYGKTDLFIFPPYDFKMVDILITNFHLPKSSLMMLVEAFLQYRGARRSLVDLYKIAIEKNYRFYSFGDAMVIL